ncbi:MAG: SDR family oxidoreductase [Saccharofermentans sp.]|nr:SDR family oxidoreductase [Saccharofermentans sp.]
MNSRDNKGKTFIVTGTSSGIGKSCALQLLSSGAKVLGIDVCESSIEDPMYNHHQASVTDEEAISGILSGTDKIDGLVNAAGIWGSGKPFFDMELSEWEKVISVNLTGTFIVSKAASKLMAANGGGKIVNISCIRSSIFRGNMADYASSKGGIVALTSAMALDLAPFGIRVNAVAPGFTYTGMTKASFDNEDIRKQSESLIPLGRLGDTEDISNVVMFLLSDLSGYMTGTNVFADGGYHILK